MVSPPRDAWNYAFTVQESMRTIRTRSITPTAVSVTEETNYDALMTLQGMALRGAPLTCPDRLNRQALASALRLPPEIYNYLVFGGREAEGAETMGPLPLSDSAPAVSTDEFAPFRGRPPYLPR